MPVSSACYARRMRGEQFEGFGVWLIISLAIWAMLIIGIAVEGFVNEREPDKRLALLDGPTGGG